MFFYGMVCDNIVFGKFDVIDIEILVVCKFIGLVEFMFRNVFGLVFLVGEVG